MEVNRRIVACTVVVLAACNGPSAADSDAGVSQPTASLDLTNIEYATGDPGPYGGTNGANEPLQLCEFLNSEVDFVGLVKVETVGDLQTRPVCLDKEYAEPHRDVELSEIATARGTLSSDGPAQIVWFGGRVGTPHVGETLLVQMRESEGEWFVLNKLIASNPGDYQPDEGERPVDMPADFSVLTARANAIIDDYSTECPNDMREVASDEQFAETIRTPDCPSGSADGEEDFLKDAEYVPRANNENGADAGSGDAGR